MGETKLVPIDALRPNNWYINRAKLDRVRSAWSRGEQASLPPVLVTMIDGELSLIDGHARTYAAYENGVSEICTRLRDRLRCTNTSTERAPVRGSGASPTSRVGSWTRMSTRDSGSATAAHGCWRMRKAEAANTRCSRPAYRAALAKVRVILVTLVT